jgi:hypothetical protein
MNKLFMICIMCLTFISTANADYFKAIKTGNIRSGPGTTYNIIGKSDPTTDKWNIIKKEGSWIQIGEDKWIYKSLGNIFPGEIQEIKSLMEKNHKQIQFEDQNITTSVVQVTRELTTTNFKEEERINEMNDSILIPIISGILLWLVPSIVCAVAAKERGRKWWWFLIFSLLCSPILGFLAVNTFPTKSEFE